MKLKEIDILEIDKHDLIECITNYQALGYYLNIEPKLIENKGAWGELVSVCYKVTILKEVTK